ncbi:MAG: Preprotein translocase, SecE subunit [Parcubacteria group bacterium GW2011_GWC2_38_7]|nr:MAG: Preprotein translocase, SecE subunit [Parcubacteria group bacterium GW2011_GWC2_38_7]
MLISLTCLLAYNLTNMSFKENRLVQYLISSKTELKKVTWPTRQETTKHTLVVIGISLFTASFLGVLDFAFSKILGLFIK